VFARGGETPAGFDFGPNPASAFEEVIARVTPNRLVGLGQSSVYWQAINAGIERTPRSFRPQLITVEGFGSEAISSRFERLLVRTPELSGVRRSEGHFRESDDLEEIRLHSERDGALVGAFLEQLISLSRPGSAPLRRHL
jgi:hypothetical protein